MKCDVCNIKIEHNNNVKCDKHNTIQNKKLELGELLIIDKFLKCNLHKFKKYYPSKVIKTYSLRSQ